MARTIFLLLVLLNLLALGWIYLKGDERINAGREPQRAKTELAADKVRLLVPTDNAPEALSAAQAAISPTSTAAADSCRAYAGATVAEAQEIAKAWLGKLPAAHISVNPVMPRPVFDIVIAGLVSRAAAETKLTELKKLGGGDGVQIKAEDDKRFSILMASFAERGAAEDALKSASKKGIRSAVIVHRQPALEQSTIEVHGSEVILKPLSELAASRKGLTPVACDAVKSAQ
jgi:hypothetical protein